MSGSGHWRRNVYHVEAAEPYPARCAFLCEHAIRSDQECAYHVYVGDTCYLGNHVATTVISVNDNDDRIVQFRKGERYTWAQGGKGGFICKAKKRSIFEDCTH